MTFLFFTLFTTRNLSSGYDRFIYLISIDFQDGMIES